jgi:hypothetical protein
MKLHSPNEESFVRKSKNYLRHSFSKMHCPLSFLLYPDAHMQPAGQGLGMEQDSVEGVHVSLEQVAQEVKISFAPHGVPPEKFPN